MLFATTIVLCINLSLANFLNFQNNACKNLYDYPIRLFNCYRNQDVGATTPKIIQNHGFQVESYNVTTRDGYILQLFRVPPKPSDNRKNKQPIVFVTGILSDSSAFVYVGKRSLALSLAAEGYDVWLTNHRGSKYSPGHVSLDISSREYWNWTIDTIAENDIPACIEKVAEVTKKSGSIIYVGHSRGTVLAYMYAANNPEQKFLKGVIALAPCGYQDPAIHIRLWFGLAPILKDLLPTFGQFAYAQDQDLVMSLAQMMCPSFPYICRFAADLISGHSNQFLADDLLNFFSHFPSPYCVKEYVHEGQLIETGRLQKFDYGTKKNLQVYGQQKPPIYDLKKISLPFYLYYGLHDVFVTGESVTRQYNDLGSTDKGIYKIPVGTNDEKLQWAHNDCLYGKDLESVLNKHVKGLIGDKLRS